LAHGARRPAALGHRLAALCRAHAGNDGSGAGLAQCSCTRPVRRETGMAHRDPLRAARAEAGAWGVGSAVPSSNQIRATPPWATFRLPPLPLAREGWGEGTPRLVCSLPLRGEEANAKSVSWNGAAVHQPLHHAAYTCAILPGTSAAA